MLPVLRAAPDDPPLVTGLWLYEVGNALSTAVRRKRLKRDDAEAAMDLVSSVPVKVIHFGWLETRAAFRLAQTHELSVYDASYLQLAQQLKTPLLTLDSNLRKAAEKLGLAAKK